MAKPHSTEFPSNIDRDRFGDWLSGFTDGEGCFILQWNHRRKKKRTRATPEASFVLALRQDDTPILQLIQSFFGRGRFYINVHRTSGLNTRPQLRLVLNRSCDLVAVVIPHFERHPLRAKKARDFVLWKEGVLLIHQASARPKSGPRRNGQAARRYTDAEYARFGELVNTLREQRRFEAPPVPIPQPSPDAPLFDDLP